MIYSICLICPRCIELHYYMKAFQKQALKYSLLRPQSHFHTDNSFPFWNSVKYYTFHLHIACSSLAQLTVLCSIGAQKDEELKGIRLASPNAPRELVIHRVCYLLQVLSEVRSLAQYLEWIMITINTPERISFAGRTCQEHWSVQGSQQEMELLDLSHMRFSCSSRLFFPFSHLSCITSISCSHATMPNTTHSLAVKP